MGKLKIAYEELPHEWLLIGGRGLIAKIMNKEVPPTADPLGADSKLIVAVGPLAGTMGPQLGRISVGGKSPLTLGIKEANAGGPAGQKLDKLGIRAIIVEGIADEGKGYCLKISQDETVLVSADEYKGMKNYQLVQELHKKYDGKPAIMCIGVGGEKKYKSASVSLTDIFGDPSRNAGRGGLGAIMGSKGLKAIVIDDSGTGPVGITDQVQFRETVKSWVRTISKDIGCGLFSRLGTPLAVVSNSYQGTMPANNYGSGRAEGFRDITGEVIRRTVWERGGRMHGCMPGCVVQCSIIYNDAEGKRLCSAYEYEAVALLGANLGITDLDAIAMLKFICDDLGIDLIETGSSLGVAASAGKMRMGDVKSAMRLLMEIEQGSELGYILGNGVVSTAKAFNIGRIPAYKGQAIPAHDPRAVKGVGVTYATSPMGADHTAGLTYRTPLSETGQIANSLRFQVQAATCDTLGYCINSIPGRQASVYVFLADLLNARYGSKVTADDVFEIGKQAIRDELTFNEGAEFSKIYEPYPSFVRTEPLPPTNSVFDVADTELCGIWEQLDTLREPEKIWEIRFPRLPSMLFAVGSVKRLGEQARSLNIKNAMLIADPVMRDMGRVDEVQRLLKESEVASVLFSKVEPDPPIEEIDEAAQLWHERGCDGLIGLGGGSSMDAAKLTAVRVSQPGILAEYEALAGGTARMRSPLPPIICIPTTSGTGSETNQNAVLTDRQRKAKIPVVSDLIIPKVAIIDPVLCSSMPPWLTADTGMDALAHCVEAYVAMNTPYHPYCEALALYGVKLIGRSLRAVYDNGDDINARTDMCMAAAFGGIALYKGLGLGHAISHVLGAHYHVPHGRGCAMGLLCFVRANKQVCQKQFSDLAMALAQSDDLEVTFVKLLEDLDIPTRFRDVGIPEKDLPKIAFETTMDGANLASNPRPLSEANILELLEKFY